MTAELRSFTFEGRTLRVQMQGDDPWWIATEVGAVLELQGHGGQIVQSLDEDEKGVITVDTPGGNQQVMCVSESGLYALIFKSRKPEAKRFRKWVTSEVLPALRKTGTYTAPTMTWITAGEAKRRLGIPDGTIRGRVQSHKIPTRPEGEKQLILWESLQAHFQEYPHVPRTRPTAPAGEGSTRLGNIGLLVYGVGRAYGPAAARVLHAIEPTIFPHPDALEGGDR